MIIPVSFLSVFEAVSSFLFLFFDLITGEAASLFNLHLRLGGQLPAGEVWCLSHVSPLRVCLQWAGPLECELIRGGAC